MIQTLARKTEIDHPFGIKIETPLLVPSFSSKGFGFGKSGKSERSEVQEIYSVASEFLTETMLISSFDLHCRYLPMSERAITELTFIDSGGYEISDYHDLSAAYRHPTEPQEWSVEMLKNIYSDWPDHIPSAFVSFDHPDVRLPLEEQIENATNLFSNFPSQIHDFLIKPETVNQDYVQIKSIISNCDKLKNFHILGFTEKELGNSILSRMQAIANIRIALDDANINVPLHIFGSLDPISSVLYFLSGAEIFDGLTWLRYGYSNGQACYWNNYGALEVGIERLDDFLRWKTMQDNLNNLIELTSQMQLFLLDHDFAKLGDNASFFEQSYELLKTKIKRIK